MSSTVRHPNPRPGAPPTQGIPWYITVLWRTPLAYIARVLISFWRWYYRV